MTLMKRYDATGPAGDAERETALTEATAALQRGEVVVIPTDTVYGVAANAFDPAAVAALLAAKGRGRDVPPPVLVSNPGVLDALAVNVPEWAKALAQEFWPGALTLVCHQQPSLQWDLGETRSTVAVRVPDHALAREILDRTGPLAVSSANKHGLPAATDADQAEEMLAEDVEVIVDGGAAPGGEASTIVDCTGPDPKVLRWGAIGREELNRVLVPVGKAIAAT